MPITFVQQSSAAAAMQDIVRWSASIPAWQRDALRRICQQQKLSQEDKRELLEMCLAQRGLGTAIQPDPLNSSQIRADIAGKSVVLKAVKDVRYVNALADGQTLKFQNGGLTIVYGGNGSGKSGYARVLKKACRARSANDPILPNVYEPDPKIPASATLEYAVGATSGSAKWSDGSPTDPLLSAVSVFDSDSAIVHVEKSNDIAYTPVPLNVLASLAEACREVKQEILAEKQKVQRAVPPGLVNPHSRPHTQVGRLVAAISESSQLVDFEQLGVLSESEQDRRNKLRVELSTDPNKSAQRLRLQKQRLTQNISKMEALARTVDDASAESLIDCLTESATKSEAARITSEQLFNGEPLQGVGTDVWRVLWEAARKYSEMFAYPEQTFPVVTEGSKCVLCHQSLSTDSPARLTRFEAFVKEDVQRLADEARRAARRERDRIEAVTYTSSEEQGLLSQLRDELDLPDELISVVRRFISIGRWRRRYLLRASATTGFPPISDLSDSMISTLKRIEAELNSRIVELSSTANSDVRRRLEEKLQELDDRAWLSTVLEDVRSEIERRQKMARLNSAIGDTDTTPITTKSTALARTLVTAALRDRFAKEAERLGVAGLRVELVQTRSDYGVPKFRVSLIAKPDAEIGLVLSEGEHRCIALAAFLSELATADDQSGLVFDDPVSSLDHDYRQLTAKRLVEESLSRQVIVFTHDIVFLTQLAEQARTLRAIPFYQSIARGADKSGYCSTEAPMKVRPVLDALDALERHLKNVAYAYNSGKLDEW